MRILITGGSGFIGEQVISHLYQPTWDIINVCRSPLPSFDRITHLQLDIGSPAFVDDVLKQIPPCDHIIHCAANLDYNFDNLAVSTVNCLGIHNILKIAKIWNVQSFVYLSSIGVIGKPVDHPIYETHPVNPNTIYHASKLYGEYLAEIANGMGLNCSILRLCSPIGPGMPQNKIVSRFILDALHGKPLMIFGKGLRIQNYVDVRDIALVIQQCILKKTKGLFNLGGSSSISNIDLANECIRILKSPSKIVFSNTRDPEEDMVWDVSSEKAIREIGFSHQYSLEKSILDISKSYENCDTQ